MYPFGLMTDMFGWCSCNFKPIQSVVELLADLEDRANDTSEQELMILNSLQKYRDDNTGTNKCYNTYKNYWFNFWARRNQSPLVTPNKCLTFITELTKTLIPVSMKKIKKRKRRGNGATAAADDDSSTRTSKRVMEEWRATVREKYGTDVVISPEFF